MLVIIPKLYTIKNVKLKKKKECKYPSFQFLKEKL